MSDITFTVEGGSDIPLTVQNGDTVAIEIIETAPVDLVIEGGRGAVGPTGATGATGPQGPAGPIAGTDKQVVFNDAGTAGADQSFRFDKNSKTLILGVEGDEVFPNNPLVMVGAVDDYYQAVVHNEREGIDASSDFVATADNGTDENYYLDMGINSSVYNNPDYSAMGPNAAYVMAIGGELVLATDQASIDIVVGGTQAVDRTGSFTVDGLEMVAGQTVSVGGVPLAVETNRPEIFYGTGSPPSATGLSNGTLFFKYTE